MIEIRPTPAIIFVYYLILAAAFWLVRPRGAPAASAGLVQPLEFTLKLPRKTIVAGLVIICVLVWSVAAAMPDDRLHVSFLDVGQGDAILIRQGSRKILIDGGPGPQAINVALGKQLPFWDRRLDMLISTHPHADHLTGLVTVLQRYRVDRVLTTGLADNTPIYREWQDLLTVKNIPSITAQTGESVNLPGGAVISVISPLPESKTDIDAGGMVLRLSFGEVSFLFTADTGKEIEDRLRLDGAAITCTVLKVGHHGSETSTSSAFLEAVRPQFAVISVGADNRFGHPAPPTLQRLASRLGANHVYRTDTAGAIEFATDGKQLWRER